MADRFHQLILFEDKTFSGSHKHIFRSIADLSSFGGTSSFFVSSGCWKLFRKSQFQDAYGSVFAPRVGGYGWVGDYQVDNDSVSAVRMGRGEVIGHLCGNVEFSAGERHHDKPRTRTLPDRKPGAERVRAGSRHIRRDD